MLSWAVVFFVIALIGGIFGLRRVAGLSAELGYLLAILAILFLVVALVGGAGAGAAGDRVRNARGEEIGRATNPAGDPRDRIACAIVTREGA